MRNALLIAVPGGAIFTAFAWRISELLSPDAIGMALGMLLGVLAGLPAAALVITALRHNAPAQPDYIDAPTVYSDQVTPYYLLARRTMGIPALPDRRAEIDQLRAVLDYIEAREVSR